MNSPFSSSSFDAQNPQVRERMFRALIEYSNDVVTVIADDGTMQFKSASAHKSLGYAPEELIGQSAFDFLHPDDCDAVRAYLGRAFKGNALEENIEYRFAHKNGAWLYFEATLAHLNVPEVCLPCVIVISRDISARKRIERELSEQVLRFENAFELSPIGIALVSLGGKWQRVNRSLCESLGYTQQELLALDFQSITHPDDLEADLKHVAELLDGAREHYEMEKRYFHKNGRIVWVSLNASLVRDGNGQPEYFISQVQDISERKQNEERLRLLESVIVNANDAILITEAEPIDRPGPRIVYANEAFFKTTGYTMEEVLGKTPRILQGEKTDRAQLGKIRAALEKWQPIIVEMINYRKDGSEFWVELSIVPVADENGWYTHWISSQRDITERRAREAAHYESEARKTAIVENSLDAIVTINADGKIVEWNQAAEQIFGYTREQVKDRDLATLIIPEEFRRAHQDALRRYNQSGEAHILNQRLELPALRADGQEIIVELIVTRLPTEGEALFAGFMRDLTEQKLAESGLVAALKEAERANAAKSEFLSRMSHELRTPLNAILGFSQILQMEEDMEPLMDVVSDIHDAGKHLLLLINEVLDISRIEAGQLALSPEPVAVSEATSEAITLMAPLAAQQNVTLQADGVLDSPIYVMADRQRLVQCLLNLLANAVKYNRPDGHVYITCDSPRPEYLRIAVRDTGVGIAPEKMSRLFTPFDRLGAEQGGIEGTGLGLSLSKSLTEEMGGTLGVESTPGQGSTFWIEFPTVESVLPCAPQQSERSSAASQSGVESSVLLIEDNPRNLRVIERVFAHRPNIQLLASMQGRIGLELAQQHRPDLILLDLHLPDIQGEVILLQLKAEASTQNIPVIVISADATPGQIERLKANGAREYITKPINVPQILALVDLILSQNRGEITQS